MFIEYKNKRWTISATRNMSFLHQCLSVGYSQTKAYKAPPVSPMISITKKGKHTDLFIEEKEYEEFRSRLTKLAYEKKWFFNLKKVYKSYAKEFIEAVLALRSDITQDNFRKLFVKYSLYAPSLWLLTTLGRAVFDELRDLIVKEDSNFNVDEISSIITYPNGHTPLTLSRIDLYKIALIKNSIIKEKALLFWLKKYSHVPVNFCEDPWTIEDAQTQLARSSKNPRKELLHLEKTHIKKKKERDVLLKRLKNSKIKYIAKLLGECTLLNEFRKNVFCRVSKEWIGPLKKVAFLCGSSDWRDCYYLTPEEVIKILKGKRINISKIKKQRDVIGLTWDTHGKRITLKSNELEKFLKHTSSGSGEVMHQTEVRGVVANKGKTQGHVKVVLHRSEFSKFKKGDILVSTMTSVDFVPIMEMAGAFITNEGGITSHASIVAREMNKPCIIGTKIATKVLRDGDLVEVDAERGIVTVLKRKGESIKKK